LNNVALEDLSGVRNEVLVVAEQVRVVPDNAVAKKFEQQFDKLVSLRDCLVFADVVVIVGP